MSTKISKLLLCLIVTIMVISSVSICYATETKTDSKKEETKSTQENESVKQEIYSGDLYIFDNQDVVMDKLVDGNVFIFGKNVEITGQVNGSLFVIANNIKFEESYIRYSIFACADSIYFNGACNDLYAIADTLEMTYESYAVRDIKAIGKSSVIKAAVGRDLDLICNTVNFGDQDDMAIIYGNLRYYSKNEVTIPEKVITENGTATYLGKSALNNLSINANFIYSIIVTIILLIILFTILFILFILSIIKIINNNKPKDITSDETKKDNANNIKKLKFTILSISAITLILFVICFYNLIALTIKFSSVSNGLSQFFVPSEKDIVSNTISNEIIQNVIE